MKLIRNTSIRNALKTRIKNKRTPEQIFEGPTSQNMGGIVGPSLNPTERPPTVGVGLKTRQNICTATMNSLVHI